VGGPGASFDGLTACSYSLAGDMAVEQQYAFHEYIQTLHALFIYRFFVPSSPELFSSLRSVGTNTIFVFSHLHPKFFPPSKVSHALH